MTNADKEIREAVTRFPQVKERMMIYRNFEELIGSVNKQTGTKIVAVVGADDPHTLEAVCKAQRDNIVEPVLLGDRASIVEALKMIGEDPDAMEILDVPNVAEAAFSAVHLVRQGKAEIIMKGRIQTAELLHAVVAKETGLQTQKLMSLVAFHEIPGYHKLLCITDGGMVMYPSLDEKKRILQNAVDVCHSMGIMEPKVAVLAAVEITNPKMPESVDAAALKQMNLQGEIAGCIVEGPISYDLAMSMESAKIKEYSSPVSGDPDILLVPNITVGNVLAKALVVSAGAKMAGFIVGAKAPVVLTSRGSSSEDKYLSLVLAAASV
jgi:phosphate butyryltransferase